MKQKEALKKAKQEPETDLNGNVIMPRYAYVTSHTARRTGITNMYLSHRYTMPRIMTSAAIRLKRPSWTASSSPPTR